MHHFARRTAGFTAVLAAAGLVLAACGDNDDKGDSAKTGMASMTGMVTSMMSPGAATTTHAEGSATHTEGSATKTSGAAAAEGTKIATPGGEISVDGDIYKKYEQLGGPTGTLGLPLQAEEQGPDDGEYQDFAGGTIYEAKDGEPHVVWGEIRKAWEDNGGAQGQLGYPVSDEKDIPGGKQSDFSGGTITWVNGTITVTPK
ncbi:esterase [Nocardia implantans]|uniref:Esterase n=1 Tax=Nocardia implantans TaxID=3108168 RepID=A0ABU6B1G1_9NOCA|nr:MULTISPECIES: esterase [unclassified Nocardia]MBF6195477.1 esterase [Nocardia beijingensis]MEA3532013.1 esterase [Nocardia sp. CDC192]MEB3513397.1 esterase [Nocardia sp. CDC186]